MKKFIDILVIVNVVGGTVELVSKIINRKRNRTANEIQLEVAIAQYNDMIKKEIENDELRSEIRILRNSIEELKGN